MDKSSLSTKDIKKRIKSSFISLTSRQVILRLLGFVTINIILARKLPVETLGIFNIATAIVTFFAFFSDIGLAASLIQKKEKIEESDIKTTFTLQQLLVLTLSLIIIIFAQWFGHFYNLDSAGVWLIRALGVSFFLTSLKVLPSVLLERELRFGPLVFVEVVETLTFNILLVYFVFNGFGVISFAIATIVKSFIGVAVTYIIAPVKLRLGIEKEAAKRLLAFGLPYQTNSILALVKDRLVPLVIARMVGAAGIGYITWSQALAFLPLELMTAINRITFPAFSRLQDDKEALSRGIEKSLFVTSLIVYPTLFGLGAILPSVVTYVVSAKWQPAVFSFYLFATSTYWAVISTTLTNTLNAIGKIKQTLKLMIMWTVLTWVLTPALVYFYGYIGVGMASFIISFSSVITIILVKRILVIKVLDAVILPTLASALMGVSVYLFSLNFIRDRFSLGIGVLLGILIYTGLIYLLAGKKIKEDLRSLRGG